MAVKNLRVEVRPDHVAVLAIDRPQALNALNSEVIGEFSLALRELKAAPGLKALIVTGAGEKAFIAGADIAEMAELNSGQAELFAKKGQELTQELEGFPVPVIAAVNGFALGGGCEIAISCDMIIASTKAVFGQPEVALGLIPGFGATVRLAELVGWPMARELIFTGRRIKSDQALRVGLVSRIVEPQDLVSAAVALALEIAANSPAAVRKAKETMRRVRDRVTRAEKLAEEAGAFGDVFGTHDQREGTRAFLEKRKPAFGA